MTAFKIGDRVRVKGCPELGGLVGVVDGFDTIDDGDGTDAEPVVVVAGLHPDAVDVDELIGPAWLELEAASIERLSGLGYDRLNASEQLLALQATCAAEDLVNRAGVMRHQGAECAAFADRLEQVAAQLSYEALVALKTTKEKAA